MVSMTSPEVTVLMSVYNGGQYLHEAIHSILNQTFKDFDFLIIDDASNDNTPNIISSFKDTRINLIRNSENLGLTLSLNKGLQLTNCKYIARMDADDISLPNRLLEQVKFLDNNPDIGVCGTWIKTFGNAKRLIKYPISDEDIKVKMLTQNPLSHPTVMIRRDVLVISGLHYNVDYYTSQDYRLWIDLVPFTKFYNIPKVLLKYRISKNQITRQLNNLQQDCSNKIWLNQLNYLGINPDINEKEVHIRMIKNKIHSLDDLNQIKAWLDLLMQVNSESGIYNQKALSDYIEELKRRSSKYYVLNNFYLNKKKKYAMICDLLFSDAKLIKHLTVSQVIKFVIKVILRK